MADELQAEWERVRTQLNVAQGRIRFNVENDLLQAEQASRACLHAESALRSARRALQAHRRGRPGMAATVRRRLEHARGAIARLQGAAQQPVLPFLEEA